MPRICIIYTFSALVLQRNSSYSTHWSRHSHVDTKPTDYIWRLARWCLRLSEFCFGVEHCDGLKHRATKAISRLDTVVRVKILLACNLPLNATSYVDGLHASIHLFTTSEDHWQPAPGADTLNYRIKDDAKPVFQIIRALRQERFCHARVAHIRQLKCKFMIKKIVGAKDTHWWRNPISNTLVTSPTSVETITVPLDCKTFWPVLYVWCSPGNFSLALYSWQCGLWCTKLHKRYPKQP